MPVILYPDPRLGDAAAPAPVDDRLRKVGERLLAAAVESEAYGLAAAHVGEVEPVVVVSLDEAANVRLVLYNPRVTATAQETASGTEGSVSLPGIRVEVTRPVWCELAFQNAQGEPHTLRLDGFAARVAQHEIEQMNGVFFLSHLSRLKRDIILKKWKKRAG